MGQFLYYLYPDKRNITRPDILQLTIINSVQLFFLIKLVFNNKRLPNYTFFNIYMCLYAYVCVCVCVSVCARA